eukprot:673562-Amorphochlora_amoeboformis.AAC.2
MSYFLLPVEIQWVRTVSQRTYAKHIPGKSGIYRFLSHSFKPSLQARQKSDMYGVAMGWFWPKSRSSNPGIFRNPGIQHGF